MAGILRGQGHLQPYQTEDLGRLARGRDHWLQGTQASVNHGQYVQFVLDRQSIRMRGVKKLKEAAAQHPAGVVLPAQIHEGRWVALCECGGAEVVDPEEPAFYCFSCYNVTNEGRPRPVDFPAQWRAIERVLLARPMATTRGYIPSETLNSLRAENIAHGLPEQAV